MGRGGSGKRRKAQACRPQQLAVLNGLGEKTNAAIMSTYLIIFCESNGAFRETN